MIETLVTMCNYSENWWVTSSKSLIWPNQTVNTQGNSRYKRSRPPDSLINIVASTLATSNLNNVIKFNYNSSAIEGFNDLSLLRPDNFCRLSDMRLARNQHGHIISTVKTHNFPTKVTPFFGAPTGTGVGIRDVWATGRGGQTVARIIALILGGEDTSSAAQADKKDAKMGSRWQLILFETSRQRRRDKH